MKSTYGWLFLASALVIATALAWQVWSRPVPPPERAAKAPAVDSRRDAESYEDIHRGMLRHTGNTFHELTSYAGRRSK